MIVCIAVSCVQIALCVHACVHTTIMLFINCALHSETIFGFQFGDHFLHLYQAGLRPFSIFSYFFFSFFLSFSSFPLLFFYQQLSYLFLPREGAQDFCFSFQELCFSCSFPLILNNKKISKKSGQWLHIKSLIPSFQFS